MKTKNGYVLYSIPPKNMMIVCILEVLRNYSDKEHPLSQAKIVKYLETDFSLKVNRQSIKPNLLNLMDLGYSLNYAEIERKNGTICTEWYLDKPFTEDELRIIYSSILASDELTNNQALAIINKLQKVLNKSIT